MALICRPQGYHALYLWLVYCLSDQNPNPVDCRLSPINATVVCHHGPRGEFYSTLLAWYPQSESHLVRVSHPRALHCHGLLRNPCLKCSGLACHCA